MKRIFLVAAIFAIAACSKAEAPATDTTTPALTPAPADSAIVADSTAKDSTAKADSAGHSAHADSATVTP